MFGKLLFNAVMFGASVVLDRTLDGEVGPIEVGPIEDLETAAGDNETIEESTYGSRNL